MTLANNAVYCTGASAVEASGLSGGSLSGVSLDNSRFFSGERTRQSPFDVGAYETDGLASNPGWKVVAGFKQKSGSAPKSASAPTSLRLQ